MASHNDGSSEWSDTVDADAFSLDVARDGTVWVCTLNGELDTRVAPLLERKVRPLLDGDAELVVLDLEGLTFLDSSGLSALVRLTNYSRAHGDSLRMFRAGGHVGRVMHLTGMGDELPFISRDDLL